MEITGITINGEDGASKIENDIFGFVNNKYDIEIDNLIDVVKQTVKNVDGNIGRYNLKVELTIFVTYCYSSYFNESKMSKVYYLKGDLTKVMKIITDNIIDYIEHCKVA